MPNVFRNLPSVSELLESPPLKSLIDRVNRNVVVTRVKHFLDDMQSQLRTATAGMRVPAPAELALRIADWINAERGPAIVPVINATGIILHHGLGGVPLADEAVAESAALTRGYASFNLNLATGSDSAATASVERQLQQLTGGEAATITSNLAGAAIVALAAVANGQEVIVARGEVTAIDESSRVPDLFPLSGAKLRETGTANVTRIEDYAAAMCPQSAAILRISASGFAVIGTAAQPALSELVSLARKSDVAIMNCLTQASLLDLSAFGVTEVPQVADSIAAGADLTIFPGDGFIGGPPCGILVGRRSLIEKINAHPLLSAVRADKLTLAALGATLRLYNDQETAQRTIPVLSLLATPLENLRQRAERLAPQIAVTGMATVEVLIAQSFIAGHEVPGQALPTVVLSLALKEGKAQDLATALQICAPAVIAQVRDDRLLLDLRSVMPRDDLALVGAFTSMLPASVISIES